MEKLQHNPEKLTHIGSMNYIVQVWRHQDGTMSFDQYQPRKNRIWREENDPDTEQVTASVEETIERMKIAINLFQEFLDGKRDTVYYWEEDTK